MFYQTLRKEG